MTHISKDSLSHDPKTKKRKMALSCSGNICKHRGKESRRGWVSRRPRMPCTRVSTVGTGALNWFKLCNYRRTKEADLTWREVLAIPRRIN